MRQSRYTKDLLVCLFRCWSDRPSTRWVRWAVALAFAAFAWPTNIALADEGGVSIGKDKRGDPWCSDFVS